MTEDKKKAASARKQLVDLINKLSEEDLQYLERELGVVVPPKIDDIDQPHKWGYTCSNCGKVAVWFIGDDRPEVSKVTARLPWTQRGFLSRDRSKPQCPFCFRGLALTAGRFMTKRVVNLEELEQQKSDSEEAVKKRFAELKSSVGVSVDVRDSGMARPSIVDIHASAKTHGEKHLSIDDVRAAVAEADRMFNFTDMIRGK